MGSRASFRLILIGLGFFVFASEGFANWTLNVGYHNPRPATYGLNFFYIGSQWGFEAGVGWVDVKAEGATKDDDDDDDDTKNDDDKSESSLTIGGDFDVKYFATSGAARLYLLAGLGAGIGANGDSGIHAGAGGPFGGIGVFAGSPSLYVYVAATVDGSADYPRGEAGIGFDI